MTKNYTDRCEELAKELGVEVSVAMDIEYLRMQERRIIEIAKKDTTLRYFPVHNPQLDEQLTRYEVKLGI